MRRLVLVLTLVLPATHALGQARQSKVRGTLVNGTTGGPGQAEKVTLFRLASGMEPIATLEDVSESFELEGVELEGGSPHLLQVTSRGVNYNQPIRLEPDRETELSFTVYDVTSDPSVLEVKSARYLLRRKHNRLRVEKLYVVENQSKPRQTFYDSEGTFRFHLPTDLLETVSVTVSGAHGMPVPQPVFPALDGSGYATRTAFQPGPTDVVISYDVDYATGSYLLQEEAYYPLAKLLVLVEPSDIELDGDGWENLSPEPRNRFSVLRRSHVVAGSPIELKLSGGSEHAAPMASSEGDGEPPHGAHGRITRLPDQTRRQKWMIAILMGAALAFGLMSGLVPDRVRK